MRSARRFPQRLVRWTSLCVCLTLLLTSLAVFPLDQVSSLGAIALSQGKADPHNDKAKKVKPQPPERGTPFANLPNLDEVKRQRQPEPEAPPSIPSTIRSRRKPLEDRRGKKVGDPGTSLTKNSNATEAKDSAKVAKDIPLHSSAKTSATSAFSALRSFKQSKFHHGNKSAIGSREARMSMPPPVPDDQFISNFIDKALARNASSSELTYWKDILRSANAQGLSAELLATRELGRTIFESADYAARNRSNHDYVYDLYETYLMRDPGNPYDSGWAFWENQCNSYGRAAVRAAFDESIEFHDLVAAMTPNGSITSAVSSIAAARVDPFNQTGDQLRARDGEWSLGLLSLPGRAGLDLGLGLSYSSLVWTRSGPLAPYVYFDEDYSSISPGFRIGFASIQGPYFDAQVGRKVYLLVSSSGGRVELRQVGTSTVYEAADSSYLQLSDNGSNLLLRTTDGTQMSYTYFANGWQATQIKDRNGNYLTVNNDWRGDIISITDTLGRVINFNGDGNGNLISITQSWNGATHTWATFGWGTRTMQPGFSDAAVTGTFTGEVFPVLTQVGLHDGSYFTFDYTNALQVNLIRRYTSDNVPRSYVAYDYTTPTNDCPRLTQTRVSAENWTGVNGVPYEVATQFSEPGDGSHQMVAPDGTVYKEFYGTGWQRGLTTQSEVWSGGVRQKWTTTAWTQDNTGVNYQTNPRVNETNIYDVAGNRRRTTIEYHSSFGLPHFIVEYAADGYNWIRRTHLDYKNDSFYTDRRIIGLPFQEEVYDNTWSMISRKQFSYDEGGDHYAAQAPSVQYDATNYPSWFIAGRGNLTAVVRFNVNAPYDVNQAMRSNELGYNMAGSVVWKGDDAGHRVNISYADSFSDNNNGRGTNAYPTTVTDADGYSSYLQYNYDFGAKTRAQGPPPVNQSQGVIQTITYDSAARIQQATTTNTGAYQRYVYGPNYVQNWSSVNNVADEAYSIQFFDGAGRGYFAVGNHPGSVGGYRAQWTQFDLMGRAMKQSNPTEVNSGNAPAGDDATGWIFTQQTYDWKGRPLVTTHLADGTQKYASYSACGCAGSEVVTLTDEVGRQQKVYSDVLGRTAKSEVLNWGGSVYSTTSNIYNARDQVTAVRQYQGPDTSGVYQDTTMNYDGHGRLQSKHVPEQTSGTATTYAYNSDDTVYSVTDARGASATYSYNNRHLVTGITYFAPSGVAATPNATFEYDPAGNRTSATQRDSQNNVVGANTYGYDQLSRMTSETYQFADLSGSYTLNYAYNLGGELTSLSIPFTSQSIGYSYDSTGRLSSMSASGFNASYTVWPNTYTQSVTSFISNIAYRAWGAPKSVTYGNNVSESTNYNSRLEPTSYTLGVNYTNYYVYPAPNYSSMSWSYDYYADGRVNHAYDSTWNFWDRSYSYDHAGRLAEADTNRVARGQSWDQGHADPYKQTWTYDVWNNLKRTGYLFNSQNIDQPTYTNNRRPDSSYDANGNITAGTSYQNTFDVFGSNTHMQSVQHVGDSSPALEIAQTYAADGRPAKRTQIMRQNDFDPDTGDFIGVSEATLTSHYIHSSVLGARVVEIDQYGQFNVWVYAGGKRIATANTGTYANTTFEHHNPVTGSYVQTNGYSPSHWVIRQERDPMNAEMPLENPGSGGGYASSNWDQLLFIEGGDPFDFSGGCNQDGIAISCGTALLGATIGGTQIQTWGGGSGSFVSLLVKVDDPETSDITGGEMNIYEHYHYETQLTWVPGGGATITPRSIVPQNPAPPSLRDAIDLAKKLLADPKGDCAGLFKKGNGLSTLNDLDKKNKIKIADTKVKLFGGPERLLSSMPGVGGVTTSKGIFINPAGRIAQGNPSPTGPFGKLTPLEAFAAAIIHEDAHKTGDFPTEAKPEESIFHNADIVDACFGGRRP